MAIVSSVIEGYPFFLQKETGSVDPIYYSASDMRKMLNAIVPKAGALGDGWAFHVTQADNVGMSIRVTGGCYILGDYLTGGYMVHTESPQTINLFTFDSSPAATRTHRVYLSVYDGLVAGTEYAAKIEVMEDQGGGAGVPTGATIYAELATISVAKNQGNIQNANITDMRTYAGMGSRYYYLYNSLAAAYDPAGDETDMSNFRASINNGVVRLSGVIRRSNNADFAAGSTHTLGTLPWYLWPNRARYLAGSCAGSTDTWRLHVSAKGTLIALVGPATARLHFDGITYELD